MDPFTIWLIGLLIVFILIEIATVRETHLGWGIIIVFLTLMFWFGPFNPFLWIWNNPLTLATYAGIYIGIGCLYGFVKWFFHLKNVRDDLYPARLQGLRESYEKDKVNAFEGSFTLWLEHKHYIPLAKNNKWRISVWMAWWPFSLLWTLFHDILRRFWEMIVEHYLVVFNKINSIVFGHLNEK